MVDRTMTDFSFLSVFFIYSLVRLITTIQKNNFDKSQMLSIFFLLFITGLSIHYNRYPDMQVETILMALCYPFMGYLALKQVRDKGNK